MKKNSLSINQSRTQKLLLLVGFLFLASNYMSAQTLYSPSNTYIVNKSIKDDTSGIIWWKCDSMLHGDLFSAHLAHTGLGDSDEMVEFRMWEDPFDCMHFTSYIQKHNGIRVEGGEVRENWNPQTGHIILTVGRIVEELHLPYIPSIMDTVALDIALDSLGDQPYAWLDDTLELNLREDSIPEYSTYYPTGELVYALLGDLRNVASNYRLAWKFRIWATNDTLDELKTVYVDAHNGEILRIMEGTCSGSFNHIFYGNQYLDTRWHGGLLSSHFLWTNDNGVNIKTKNHDVPNNQDNNWKIKKLPDDDDDNWGSNFWSETSSHYVVTNAWMFFKSEYGLSGLNNQNKEIRIQSDFNSHGQNAEFAEQLTNPDHDYFRFGRGNGNGSDHLTASYDVAGHEYTHGVALYGLSSGFGFYGDHENGAIDESYCDIFGFMCERFAQPSLWDWNQGEDISGLENRNHQYPSSTPTTLEGTDDYFPEYYPDYYHGTNYYYGAGDVGGIHINCTVQSHCFYLLAMGGTGYNSITVSGLGIDVAARIAYYALVNFAEEEETFLLSRKHWITAAEKIYGICSPEAFQTCKAWAAVNVGVPCDPCDIEEYPCHNCADASPLRTNDQFAVTSKLESTRVYPNPSGSALNIDLPEFTLFDFKSIVPTFYIYDGLGSLVKYDNLPKSNNPVDLSNLLPGLYYLRVNYSNQTKVWVIEKI